MKLLFPKDYKCEYIVVVVNMLLLFITMLRNTFHDHNLSPFFKNSNSFLNEMNTFMCWSYKDCVSSCSSK